MERTDKGLGVLLLLTLFLLYPWRNSVHFSAAPTSKQTTKKSSKLPPKRWVADKAHSALQFSTSHFGTYSLVGRFDSFAIEMFTRKAPKGTLQDFSGAVIRGKVFIKSVNMPNPKMMGSLKNKEYFNATKFPVATFQSYSMKRISPKLYDLVGKLTIKGKSTTFRMKAHFGGYSYPNEKDILGFKVVGHVDRHFFGVGGKHKLHSGFPLIGGKVKIVLHLRMEAH